MAKMLKFTKMHSLGNDFMLVDGLSQEAEFNVSEIKGWSNRNTGIGFDQLLVVEPPESPKSDFFFRIYNADGSEAEQCGNGTRCAARFAIEKGLTKKEVIEWQSLGGNFVTSYHSNDEIQTQISLSGSGCKTIEIENTGLEEIREVHSINIGNPHAVTFVSNIHNLDVDSIGSAISKSQEFPEGVNVGFCQVVDRGFLRLRVFERGVGETMACGTGACAASIVSASKELTNNKVKVSMPGGKLKLVNQPEKKSILLTGPAAKVFDGKLEI